MEYKQLLAIKNNRTNRYLTIEQARPYASANHPFMKHPDSTSQTEIFQILNASNQDYAGPILFQSTILIYCPSTQQYLCCLPNGEMKFEKLAPHDALINKSTKFLIHSNSKKQVTHFDEIVFKFNETNYMISELSLQCSWNGPNISQDSTWKLQSALQPPIPDWFYSRPNISLSYLQQSEQYSQYLTKKDERKTLGSHVVMIQQIYLIEDILFAMMGIEGTYIKKKNGTYEYVIEGHLEQTTCDISLQQLVYKILPMCSQHDQIEYYIMLKSKFEYGYVSQALCSGLRELLQKYTLMVNQLDQEFLKGELSLNKMWYYLQSSIKLIDSLYTLVMQTQKTQGGALLSKLLDLMNANTDLSIIEVYQYLLQKAFIPYMTQLANWLYEAKISDPFEEFLVAEKKIQKQLVSNDYKDEYWDTRFTLREQQVPKFLEKYVDIILRTGKYLNILGNVVSPFDNYLIKNQGHIVQIQDFSHILQTFEWANTQIIDLLFKQQQIKERIKSIKSFMLFDQGDFFIQFMEAAETELNKDCKEISKEKLESLFDIAIRNVALGDPYKEDMICYLDTYTTTEQIFAYVQLKGQLNENKPQRQLKLKGIDVFTLDVKVQWPNNLILSRATLVCYQIIFRSIFNLHYLERQLNTAWTNQKSIKILHHKFSKQNALLGRMIHFVKSFLYYISYDVIEKNYQILLTRLDNVSNFEEVKSFHSKFIEDCLQESLFTDDQFNKILQRIFNNCIQFCKQIAQQSTKIVANYGEGQKLITKQLIDGLLKEKTFKEIQTKYIEMYESDVKELLKLIKIMQLYKLFQDFKIKGLFDIPDNKIRFRI